MVSYYHRFSQDINKQQKEFMFLFGLEASLNESSIFEEDYQIEAMSTVKGLRLINQGQIPGVQTKKITMTNISDIDTLQVSDQLKTKYRDSVRQGNTLYTPTKQYTYQNWTGLVYISINPNTGFGSYIIGEGLNGGYTACAVPTTGMQAQQGMCYWPGGEVNFFKWLGYFNLAEAEILEPAIGTSFCQASRQTLPWKIKYVFVGIYTRTEQGELQAVDKLKPGTHSVNSGYNTNQQRTFTILNCIKISTDSKQLIDKESPVQNNIVNYKRRLKILALDDNGQPRQGLQFNLSTNDINSQIKQQPRPTDKFGETFFEVLSKGFADENLKRTKTVKIMGEVLNGPGIVVPLDSFFYEQAVYESPFLITGYHTPLESEFTGQTVVNPPGLTGEYNYDFLYSFQGVVGQGSGKARNNDYIQINWQLSNPGTGYWVFVADPECARTAQGNCVRTGHTIAVDTATIPYDKYVDITSRNIGVRYAEDAGGAIDGYHIDLYLGEGNAVVNNWLKSGGDLYSTVNYLGLNP